MWITKSTAASVSAALQWGRGLGAAECDGIFGWTSGTSTELQWGRGLGAAEWRRASSRGCGRTSCFNGAAA